MKGRNGKGKGEGEGGKGKEEEGEEGERERKGKEERRRRSKEERDGQRGNIKVRRRIWNGGTRREYNRRKGKERGTKKDRKGKKEVAEM